MTRFLYVIVVILALVVGQKAWVLHRAWNELATDGERQAYGASADKAVVTIDAFVNYTHRPTRDISADVLDVVSKNPDTRIVFHIVAPDSMMSMKMAQIATAAALQNKFIDMHEELMRNEKPLIDQNIRDIAEKIKIDPDRLMKDIKNRQITSALKRKAQAEKALGVNASPLFVINRKWRYGPDSETAVTGDLNNLIKKARAG